MREFARVVGLATALALPGMWGCGGDLTLPESTGAGLALAVVGGNGQQGTVGQPLPNPVVVLVRSDAGQPIANRQVEFAPAEGQATSFDPDTAITDSRGEAVTKWVLGTAPGVYTAEARIVALGDAPPPVPLQAAAVAGTPDTIRPMSHTGQPGQPNQTLPEPLVVMVLDRFGNPVAGAEVAWSVAAGGGQVSADRVATAADGTSSVTWTLGAGIGLQRVTANVGGASGSPVTFTAVVLF